MDDVSTKDAIVRVDNSIRTFSSATFVALMDGVLVAKSSVSLGARQLKNQVMAAVSQAELDSIDLGVFWLKLCSRGN